MNKSPHLKCLTESEILSANGFINENSDGTVSVFMPDNLTNTLKPVFLNLECCTSLRSNYFFDSDLQQCKWSNTDICGIKNPFKIVLNPNGNDGSIFYKNDNDNCILNVSFDYLLKIKCETLLDLISSVNTNISLASPNKELLTEFENKTTLCENLDYQISELTNQINSTYYSIVCSSSIQPINTKLSNSLTNSFSNSGFGNKTYTNSADTTNVITDITPIIYCLTENDGLAAWLNILGPQNYQKFLNGDESSYTCSDIEKIKALNENNKSVLLIRCDTPFGTKTNLLKELDTLKKDKENCSNEISYLQSKIDNFTNENTLETIYSCTSPIDFFENLSLSLSLDVVDSANTINTFYEISDFFPSIGVGNLYNYIKNNNSSGFYVCGSDECISMLLDDDNTSVCDSVKKSLLTDLFTESNLPNTEEGQNIFKSNLSISAFTSDWLHFNTKVTDQNIISLLKDNKIKISINVNNICGDICILLDNIELNKECNNVRLNDIFITECPGFNLKRIIDNKKSWTSNNTERNFTIYDSENTNSIRQTSYDVNDDRLIINSKEIDLDISLASAIETDVWCYISDNPCLLTGNTFCLPCLNNCCGDNLIDFNNLMTQPLSALTTVESFEYFILTELIDVKNRQTISAYPTLRALYDRYINSHLYCGNNSSAFNYLTIEKFANLIGNYWVDIVEQVIPSTTLWGSVKIYSNSIFDQEKYKYRAYSSLFCNNSFFGSQISSPINGTSGQSANVGIDFINLPIQSGSTLTLSTNQSTDCDTIYVVQMNNSSEFIGSVNILGNSTSCSSSNNIIGECAISLSAITNGLTVSALVNNAIWPISYEWSNGDVNPITTFLTSGNYSLTVYDANCCSSTIKFNI